MVFTLRFRFLLCIIKDRWYHQTAVILMDPSTRSTSEEQSLILQWVLLVLCNFILMRSPCIGYRVISWRSYAYYCLQLMWVWPCDRAYRHDSIGYRSLVILRTAGAFCVRTLETIASKINSQMPSDITRCQWRVINYLEVIYAISCKGGKIFGVAKANIA